MKFLSISNTAWLGFCFAHFIRRLDVGLNDISEFLPEILQLCTHKKFFSIKKTFHVKQW